MFVASITNTNLGGISPNSSIFFSISMLFPVFTNRWEEVTWKRRKNRFRVEQVWTLKLGYTEHWGIQRAGPLPSPPPSQKKEGGWERDLWVAIDLFASETFTTEERIVHSRSDLLLVWKWNSSIMITLITLDHIKYHTKREYYHLLTMFYPSLVLICLYNEDG